MNLPVYFHNYKQLVEALNLPHYTSTRDRRKQEEYLKDFYSFQKIGPVYLFEEQLKPYVPPLSKRNPRETHMEIKTQLLHAIAEQKAGISRKSKYGLINEVVLTLAEGFELVGLAAAGWIQLKDGNALPDLTTLEQRRAYFTHHDACFHKWRNTVKSLVASGDIIRKDWYVFVEKLNYLEGCPTRTRLATEEEFGDCAAVDIKAMEEIRRRYPTLKLTRHVDVWLKFKEIEYEQIRRKIIQEAQEKYAQLNPNCPTTWLDVFGISRFYFTDEMVEKWKTHLKPEGEIDELKETLTLKMLDWYQLPSNADKYENVKLCLVSLLGNQV